MDWFFLPVSCALGARDSRRYNTRVTYMAQTQKSRRELLEQFVAEKPQDAFARYGLALECAKLGDDPAASDHFHKLLELHPTYVAGYFQFGQLLARLGRLDEARKLLSDGVVVAQKAGDMHARDEMQSALTSLR
jgi:tetratricopeptide (TPR) repeat protein